MLQKNIVPFLERMNRQFEHTQIESNGLINQDLPSATTLVVSPKCLEKNGVAVKYLAPNKQVLERANCLKFVMEANPKSPYSSIPDWALEWKHETGREVFISPMNRYNHEPVRNRSTQNDRSIDIRSTVDEVISFWEPGLLNMEENQKNHEYCAKYCIQHGLTLNLQIHLYASLA
jgi:7-carboxy-7-deazaguanine synthase